MSKNDILLSVENVTIVYGTRAGLVRAAKDVSFEIRKGEVFGLVGESGCGKSTLALAILRLLPPNGKIVSGRIVFNGIDLTKLPDNEMRRIRGGGISMIFQDPMSSLNPVFTIGTQLIDVLKLHRDFNDKSELLKEAVNLLDMVGIPDPETRINDYPFQFSGGMRQRAMIAMALAAHPSLLIADEPTTSLDVTIEAQILELMKSLQKKLGMSILYITHNLGVIAEMADRVAVMYAGRIVEKGTSIDVFKKQKHPYTFGLLEAIPRVDREAKRRLLEIPGEVPDLTNIPSGCAFHPRCPYVKDICKKEVPKLEHVDGEHFVACHRWKEITVGEGYYDRYHS
ncbi:MAG: ABC transporter ATP-binding protein [Candidatus Asgardarchaeia archaeon]